MKQLLESKLEVLKNTIQALIEDKNGLMESKSEHQRALAKGGLISLNTIQPIFEEIYNLTHDTLDDLTGQIETLQDEVSTAYESGFDDGRVDMVPLSKKELYG